MSSQERRDAGDPVSPPFRGGCRCGAVRYSLLVEALPPGYACHCRDCQTWTGSAFSEQLFVSENEMRVEGTPAEFRLETPSGNVSRQMACGVCFTRLFNYNSSRPGTVIVRAGTLDCSEVLAIAAHIWVDSKQDWVVLPQQCPSWPAAAPPGELAAVVARPPRNGGI